jgi:hypothetical protein
LMQAHRAYHERNRALGRLPGQIRLRVRYQNLATPWFDYLFASVEEILEARPRTGGQRLGRLGPSGG